MPTTDNIKIAGRVLSTQVRIRWYIDEVVGKIGRITRGRTSKELKFLKAKVVENISKPVTRTVGPRGGVRVTGRSKPGEYPKLETGRLAKSIFVMEFRNTKNKWDGYVATGSEHGAILELSQTLDRSYIRRTFNEEIDGVLKRITKRIL